MTSTSRTNRSSLRRGITLVAGATVLGLAIGFVAAVTTDEKWLVGAKVLLQIGPETAGTRPSMVGSPTPFLAGNPRREDVQTEVELLSSSDLLRRAFDRFLAADREQALGNEPGRVSSALRAVAESLALLPPRTREERALDKWAAAMRVAVVPSSTVLVLECKTERPQAAARLLQTMLDLYLEDHRRAFGARGMSPILGTYVTDREQALAGAEAKLTTARTQLGVVDVLNETLQLEKRRSDTEAAQKKLAGELAGAQAREQALRTLLATTPAEQRTATELRPNPTRDELDLRLATAKEALTVAQQQYLDGTPQVRQAREVVTLLQGLVDQATPTRQAGVTTGRDPLHDSLRDLQAKATAEVQGLTAEVATAQVTIAEIGKRLLALEQGRAGLQKAEQDVAEAKKDVLQAREGVRLAQIEQVLDDNKVANVTVVTPPNYLPTPLRAFGLPTRLAIVAGSALFAAGLGVAFLFWRRAAQQGEATVLPLTAGPAVPTRGDDAQHKIG